MAADAPHVHGLARGLSAWLDARAAPVLRTREGPAGRGGGDAGASTRRTRGGAARLGPRAFPQGRHGLSRKESRTGHSLLLAPQSGIVLPGQCTPTRGSDKVLLLPCEPPAPLKPVSPPAGRIRRLSGRSNPSRPHRRDQCPSPFPVSSGRSNLSSWKLATAADPLGSPSPFSSTAATITTRGRTGWTSPIRPRSMSQTPSPLLRTARDTRVTSKTRDPEVPICHDRNPYSTSKSFGSRMEGPYFLELIYFHLESPPLHYPVPNHFRDYNEFREGFLDGRFLNAGVSGKNRADDSERGLLGPLKRVQ